MKKNFGKRLVSLFLITIMVIGVMSISAFAVNTAPFEQPEIKTIEFGSYPQSRVTDSKIISELNGLSLTWTSYGYYSGTGTPGSMVQGDYMKYTDIQYKGNKYRGVIINQYRPKNSTFISNEDNSYQDENGYYPSESVIYWFKYEPLKWRVLDALSGLILCESLIDSQPLSNTVYAIDVGTNYVYFMDEQLQINVYNYIKGSVRKWLNNDFYNTAFSASEKEQIKITKICDLSEEEEEYTIRDKVLLLSRREIQKSEYGFGSGLGTDYKRKATGTDYAKCQGLFVDDGLVEIHRGYSSYLLHSSVSRVNTAAYVKYSGEVDPNAFDFGADFTCLGIRPALHIKSPFGYIQKVTIKYPYQVKNYGESYYISQEVEKVGAPVYTVKYSSSNPKIATVDEKGHVEAVSRGVCDIIVTVTDQNGNVVTDSSELTVNFTFLQWIMYIICFGWIWM